MASGAITFIHRLMHRFLLRQILMAVVAERDGLAGFDRGGLQQVIAVGAVDEMAVDALPGGDRLVDRLPFTEFRIVAFVAEQTAGGLDQACNIRLMMGMAVEAPACLYRLVPEFPGKGLLLMAAVAERGSLAAQQFPEGRIVGEVAAAAIALADRPVYALVLRQVLVTLVAERCVLMGGILGSPEQTVVGRRVSFMATGALAKDHRLMDRGTDGDGMIVAGEAETATGSFDQLCLGRLVRDMTIQAVSRCYW